MMVVFFNDSTNQHPLSGQRLSVVRIYITALFGLYSRFTPTPLKSLPSESVYP
jgi:hypothetical protein